MKVKISEIGCVISTPFKENNFGKIIINGRKNIPWRQDVKKVACKGLPTAWNVMLDKTPKVMSGITKHWYRNAFVPILMTSKSEINQDIIFGDNINPIIAKTVIMLVPTFKVNKNDSLTLW